MKHLARMLVMAYALAIMVAGVAPHCDWMFPSAQAATPVVSHAHAGEGHHAHTTPVQEPERDCAAMEMAKAIGPLPAVLVLSAPDFISLPAVFAEPEAVVATVEVRAMQPRGPPRTIGGFAAIFASNHRLLI